MARTCRLSHDALYQVELKGLSGSRRCPLQDLLTLPALVGCTVLVVGDATAAASEHTALLCRLAGLFRDENRVFVLADETDAYVGNVLAHTLRLCG